jgi:hypothetical protein
MRAMAMLFAAVLFAAPAWAQQEATPKKPTSYCNKGIQCGSHCISAKKICHKKAPAEAPAAPDSAKKKGG